MCAQYGSYLVYWYCGSESDMWVNIVTSETASTIIRVLDQSLAFNDRMSLVGVDRIILRCHLISSGIPISRLKQSHNNIIFKTAILIWKKTHFTLDRGSAVYPRDIPESMWWKDENHDNRSCNSPVFVHHLFVNICTLIFVPSVFAHLHSLTQPHR